jgi:hypothetical protein
MEIGRSVVGSVGNDLRTGQELAAEMVEKSKDLGNTA